MWPWARRTRWRARRRGGADLDGQRLWSAPLGKAGAPGWGGFAGPRRSVSVDGDRLYALGQYGEFLCLDAASGKVHWRKHLTDDFGGARPEWGFSESPLVDGPRVVLTPGGSKGAMVALDKLTGAVLWQTKDFTDPAHYSSLIAVELSGVRQYVQLTAEHVVGIAPDDGRMLWVAVRAGKTAVIPTPVARGNGVTCPPATAWGVTRSGSRGPARAG